MACVCSLPRDVSPHSELPITACESYSCSVSVLRDAVSLPTRWKCRGRSSCCHSWRRWAARVSTHCPTPPPQSASPAWLIRNRRVSFYAGGFPPKISSWFVWSLRKETIHDSWFVSFFFRWFSRQAHPEHDQESLLRAGVSVFSRPYPSLHPHGLGKRCRVYYFFNGKWLNLLIAFKLLMLFYSSDNY